MKKNLKRTLSTLLVTTLLATSIVGCAPAPAASEAPAPASSAPASEAATSEAPASEMAASESAPASGTFDWKAQSGKKLQILFNQHPYAESIIKNLPAFEEKTGIKVEYSIVPEENYFDKVTTNLNSRSGEPDVFMTGAYQIWEYAPAEYIEPLDEYIKDPTKTSPEYDFEDIYPSITGSLRWDLKPGHKTGTGNLWALPLGFEIYAMTYNKRVLTEKGITPPTTMKELVEKSAQLKEFAGPGSYGVALRGSRSWATIHPEYMTTYATVGAKDFEVENGKLVSKVNSPEAVKMTEQWVDLIKSGGAPAWSTYTWYQAAADLGAGKAAMFYGADNTTYFQNPPGASKEAGNLAWSVAPMPEGATEIKSNLWIWGISMNANSKNKDAAWYFMQYFTGKEYTKKAIVENNVVDTIRKSVFEDPEVQTLLSAADGFKETLAATITNAAIQFTPQPHFFETTTEWAATLQDLVAGKYPTVQEGMDALKAKMDKIVEDVEVE